MANRRRPEPQVVELKAFAPDEIQSAIDKLRRRIEEVKGLGQAGVRHDDQAVRNVQQSIRTAVLEIFGERSPQYRDHRYHRIWHGDMYVNMPDREIQARFAAGIPQTVAMLEGLINYLDEKRAEIGALTVPPFAEAKGALGDDVFLVHGRDDGVKQSVARFIERLGLNVIILHEQPNAGRTLIEKFVDHSEVGFAVVLLTADDRGGLVDAELSAQRFRARQNVILELGYFLGKLGRKRVCALYQKDVEIPSDYEGVLFIPIDPGGAWQLQLAREIKAAGIDVDLNRAV
jgi:predicted nucleotide-binding protein